MNSETRFFCQCGRLLTAAPTAESVVCPTCRERNTVPGSASAASSPTAVLTPAVDSTVGSYRIGRTLGQGGMGTVYEAHHENTGKRVALKILHPSLQAREDFVSRFRREARAAAQLNHPNIVRVLDVGVSNSTPFIAMEYLDGRNLLAVCNDQPPNETQALHWMRQVALGLQAASAKSITHRDIKPTNLMLQQDGQLKIADFGLAKASDTDSHLTLTGEVLGTPHYMSPEQGQGRRVDHRSDLYSLGASFYHLLCGRPPFTADTPVAVIMKHMHDEPPALRSQAPHLSAGIEKVIHRLLQKRPEDRYDGYEKLLEDLARVSRGEEPLHGAAAPRQKVRDGRTTYLMPDAIPTELLLRPAGGLRRILSLVVDLSLIEGLLFAAAWGVRGTLPDSPLRTFDSLFAESRYGLASLALLLALTYFAVGDATGGRSFGKRIFKLRVCRLDGHDLGAWRGFLRAVIVFPGIALLSPTLSHALLHIDQGTLDLGTMAQSRQLAVVGATYLGLLWLLGKFGGGRSPLQDMLCGAQVYAAQLSRTVVQRVARKRAPSWKMAIGLSLLPGIGLMYAGRIWLGLVFFSLLPLTLAIGDSGPGGFFFSLWILSGLIAAQTAARRAREARNQPGLGHDPSVIRRQET